MKATGLVRKLDDLGRIVIPKELRTTRNFAEGTPLEIFVQDDDIILRKYSPECCICGSMDGVETINTGAKVCAVCRAALSEGRSVMEMRRHRGNAAGLR